VTAPQIIAEGSGFSVFCLPTGPLETNTYLLVSGSEAAIVDPAGDAPVFEKLLKSRHTPLKRILITHAHADHIAGCADIKRLFPDALLTVPNLESDWLDHPALSLSYYIGGIPAVPTADAHVQNGDTVQIGTVVLQCLLLPGHTPGSTAFYAPTENLLFCGDVLFEGSIGRVDLPGGDESAMLNSLQTVASMPPDTFVLPGHGPHTTIAQELARNPYLTPYATRRYRPHG
jgi:glyoxylase-like metal-dependent hydrolase (beta-lactamase superfamily II)